MVIKNFIKTLKEKFKKKPNRTVFVFTGFRGCGKDFTFPELLKFNGTDKEIDLIKNGSFTRFAIADIVKSYIHEVYGFTMAQIEKYKSKEYKNYKFDLGIRKLNMRQILISTANTIRKYAGKDFWVKYTIKEIKEKISFNKTINIIPIITDLRFIEEYELLKKNFQIKIIKIEGVNCKNCEKGNDDELDIESIPVDFIYHNYCQDKENLEEEIEKLQADKTLRV